MSDKVELYTQECLVKQVFESIQKCGKYKQTGKCINDAFNNVDQIVLNSCIMLKLRESKSDK
jgi:hypothetical protein